MESILIFLLPFIFLNCQPDIEGANEVLLEKLNASEEILERNENLQIDSSKFDFSKIQELTLPPSPDTMVREIVLAKKIVISWDNKAHTILDDNNWKQLKKNIKTNEGQLIKLLTDTTKTMAYGCPSVSRLTKGQMAFIVLDEINSFPYFKIFKIQFDVFMEGCQYPIDLLDFVARESKFVQTELRNFLQSK